MNYIKITIEHHDVDFPAEFGIVDTKSEYKTQWEQMGSNCNDEYIPKHERIAEVLRTIFKMAFPDDSIIEIIATALVDVITDASDRQVEFSEKSERLKILKNEIVTILSLFRG